MGRTASETSGGWHTVRLAHHGGFADSRLLAITVFLLFTVSPLCIALRWYALRKMEKEYGLDLRLPSPRMWTEVPEHSPRARNAADRGEGSKGAEGGHR